MVILLYPLFWLYILCIFWFKWRIDLYFLHTKLKRTIKRYKKGINSMNVELNRLSSAAIETAKAVDKLNKHLQNE